MYNIANNYKLQLIIRRILANIVEQQLTFYQFMSIIGNNNIKIYTQNDMKKISWLFQHNNNILKKQIPFAHLELINVQITYHCKYYIVKYCKKINISYAFNENNFAQKSEISRNKCMKYFIKIMHSHYGSYNNWFKVLGGLTIAVSIDRLTLLRNLHMILKNTCLLDSCEDITNQFMHPNARYLDWNTFMQSIKMLKSKFHSPQKKSKSKSKTSQTNQFTINSIKCMLHPRSTISSQFISKSCKTQMNFYEKKKTQPSENQKREVVSTQSCWRKQDFFDKIKMKYSRPLDKKNRQLKIKDKQRTISLEQKRIKLQRINKQKFFNKKNIDSFMKIQQNRTLI